MHIYFIGINGAGMSALAHFTLDADYSVSGSDMESGINTKQLEARGAQISLGDEAQNILNTHTNERINTVVVSSAIPDSSPELLFARDNNIEVVKRGPYINQLLTDFKLKLVAVAGTHGKTTTSAMTVWLMQQLEEPVSHIVGTNLNFANAGAYVPGSKYLVLEADEYDRLMLDFSPEITAIVSLDYDHPDIYKTEQAYVSAFKQLVEQSKKTITWESEAKILDLNEEDYFVLHEDRKFEQISLYGSHNRKNAWLAVTVVGMMRDSVGFSPDEWKDLAESISTFPGSGRRFEQIAGNIYSDYGHSPVEIAATLQLAREVAEHDQKIIVVYQPHQNIRQHLVRKDYHHALDSADAVYWLPTYLSREDPELEALSPEKLIQELSDPTIATPADMNKELIDNIKNHQANGDLVILFGAGSIDDWARANLL